MIPDGISDRYDIVQILQETAATAVLLVNYKKIGALRILKAIHRAHPNAHSILSEAHLLQGIKSSQIPTIISVEDTDEMYYLVEEYVEGQSLREYLLDTTITKETLLNIAISLCIVIEALHNADGGPILYRDMKPEHVILQNDTVRLIDFGIAVRKSEAAKARPLGTINWAAPEQLKAGPLDERCDVFGVGKIIEFMQKNSLEKDDYKLRKLVSQATDEDINNRISSITILKNRLLELQDKTINKYEDKRYLCKKIAVVGAAHAVADDRIFVLVQLVDRAADDGQQGNDNHDQDDELALDRLRMKVDHLALVFKSVHVWLGRLLSFHKQTAQHHDDEAQCREDTEIQSHPLLSE